MRLDLVFNKFADISTTLSNNLTTRVEWMSRAEVANAG